MKYLLTESHRIGGDSNVGISPDLPERTVIKVELNVVGEYDIDSESINYNGETFVAKSLNSSKDIILHPHEKYKGYWQDPQKQEMFHRCQGEDEILFSSTNDQIMPKTLTFRKCK